MIFLQADQKMVKLLKRQHCENWRKRQATAEKLEWLGRFLWARGAMSGWLK